jgi:hypothetical protein
MSQGVFVYSGDSANRMTGNSIDERIRGAWRQLGFHYDWVNEAREIRIVGSREGLLRFRDALRQYSDNENNDSVSEHDHIGPYYLKIMTWEFPAIDESGIRGSVADLARLADIISAKVETLREGDTSKIRDEYAAESPSGLRLDLRGEKFDPSSLDSSLQKVPEKK